MTEKYYRGYILLRLAKIGSEWQVCDKFAKYKDAAGSWLVTYTAPVYGSWDVVIEVSFKKLEDLDVVVSALRSDDELRENIEETTTLVSARPNYPLD